jgi:hypothetical protein
MAMGDDVLPDHVATRIRAEETYRLSVRSELEAKVRRPDDAAGTGARIWKVLNSQFGGWLLSTVLVTGVGLMWTTWQERLHKAEQKTARLRAQAIQDVQLVTDLLPSLAKTGTVESALAVELVARLQKDNAIDVRFARKLRALLVKVREDNLKVAQDPATKPEQQAAARDTAKAADLALATTKSHERATSEKARIYVQIARDDQRERAKGLLPVFREKGFAMPGVELVPDAKVDGTEVRYFNVEDREKADDAVALLKANGFPTAEAKKNPARASAGHLEIWIGRTEPGGTTTTVAQTPRPDQTSDDQARRKAALEKLVPYSTNPDIVRADALLDVGLKKARADLGIASTEPVVACIDKRLCLTTDAVYFVDSGKKCRIPYVDLPTLTVQRKFGNPMAVKLKDDCSITFLPPKFTSSDFESLLASIRELVEREPTLFGAGSPR